MTDTPTAEYVERVVAQLEGLVLGGPCGLTGGDIVALLRAQAARIAELEAEVFELDSEC